LGLASLAAAFVQGMEQLIACRFVRGLGLGAEIVEGYSTLIEFVPPALQRSMARGSWRSRWLACRQPNLRDRADLGLAYHHPVVRHTLVLACGSLVGSTLGAFVCDFIGRRWSIIRRLDPHRRVGWALRGMQRRL
jgi:MFS family permease